MDDEARDALFRRLEESVLERLGMLEQRAEMMACAAELVVERATLRSFGRTLDEIWALPEAT